MEHATYCLVSSRGYASSSMFSINQGLALLQSLLCSTLDNDNEVPPITELHKSSYSRICIDQWDPISCTESLSSPITIVCAKKYKNIYIFNNNSENADRRYQASRNTWETKSVGWVAVFKMQMCLWRFVSCPMHVFPPCSCLIEKVEASLSLLQLTVGLNLMILMMHSRDLKVSWR